MSIINDSTIINIVGDKCGNMIHKQDGLWYLLPRCFSCPYTHYSSCFPDYLHCFNRVKIPNVDYKTIELIKIMDNSGITSIYNGIDYCIIQCVDELYAIGNIKDHFFNFFGKNNKIENGKMEIDIIPNIKKICCCREYLLVLTHDGQIFIYRNGIYTLFAKEHDFIDIWNTWDNDSFDNKILFLEYNGKLNMRLKHKNFDQVRRDPCRSGYQFKLITDNKDLTFVLNSKTNLCWSPSNHFNFPLI